MVNLTQDEVSLDKSEQKIMGDSNLAPDKSDQKTKEGSSDQIENPPSLSKLPQKENGESQNGEIVSSEQKQSQSSTFSNELAIIESRGSYTCTGGMLSSMPETLPGGQSGQRANSMTPPSKYPDKALEDGYNWRKYGQKFVKGNEFVRSYYRCTHPSCRVKRQVERSHDGHITDTVYIGNHTHFEARVGAQASVCNVFPIQSIETEGDPLVTEKDKSSDAHIPASTSHEAKPMGSPQLPSTPMKNVSDGSNSLLVETKLTRDEINDGDPPSKRQKRDGCDIDEIPMEKPYGEPRFVGDPRVVQTMSEVDVLPDGYRWRKYGQKLVKGNPNPRSYYRCSSSGCPAKKHVERAAHDAKTVITTYEGQHDHDMPPARTVAHNRREMSNTTPVKDETTLKPEGKITDMVVHVSAN